MPTNPPPRGEPMLVRALGFRALSASAINCLVGAGIFLLPAVAARELGAAAVVAYVVCAVAIGLVLLCFAEAGSRVAATGGLYAYAGAAFGPFVGFLMGVLLWFAAGVIAAATVANAFVAALAELAPRLGAGPPRAMLLGGTYLLLAALNIRGVRTGARVVEGVTVAKLLPLLILIVAGLFAVRPEFLRWEALPRPDDVGRAAIVLVFAFFGIEVALTPSGEVRDPARTVPRAVLLALGSVTLLYVLLQTVAQGVLDGELARHANAPLAEAAGRVLGAGGRLLVLVGAAVAALGYLSGDMLGTPRSLFALARDGALPTVLAWIHPRRRTPAVAIAVHATLTCTFAVTGSFRGLAVIANVGGLVLYLVCCLAVLELRRRDIRTEAPPFRVPGGPAVPLAASALLLWLLWNASLREYAAIGALLAVASLVFLARWGRRARRGRREAAPVRL